MSLTAARAAAVVTMFTGGVLAGWTGQAAATTAEYGWWSAASAPGGVPVSAPVGLPGAPTDGIYAAVGPTIPGVTGPVPDVVGGQVPAAFSPLAVGAIRFPAGATDSAVLTLDITASSSPPQQLRGQLTSALLACPIAHASWKPAQNGAFADKPDFNCGGIASVGTVSSDGKQATWQLSPVYQSPSGTFDVALVVAAQSPYFVSFAKPSSRAVTIIPGDSPSPDLGSGPSNVSVPPAANTSVPTSLSSVDTGSVAAVAAPVDSSTNVTPTEAAPAADTATPATTAKPRYGARQKLAGVVPKARDSWRIFFGALLVLIGGGLFWMAGQTARAPQLIGPLHAAAADMPPDTDPSGVRGIGRYARPRIGTPRRLR